MINRLIIYFKYFVILDKIFENFYLVGSFRIYFYDRSEYLF